MTDFSDLKAQIADYANRQDWSDALVTGFIRQAEQKFNAELRVDRMIQTDARTSSPAAARRCPTIGSRWTSSRSPTRTPPTAGCRSATRRATSSSTSVDSLAYGYYTIEGREITFGGTPDAINGIGYKISYYGEVPVIADATPSWIYTKYPSLYLYGSLMHADLHAVGEEDNAARMKQPLPTT